GAHRPRPRDRGGVRAPGRPARGLPVPRPRPARGAPLPRGDSGARHVRAGARGRRLAPGRPRGLGGARAAGARAAARPGAAPRRAPPLPGGGAHAGRAAARGGGALPRRAGELGPVSAPRRLLLLTTELLPAGAEQVVYELATRLPSE